MNEHPKDSASCMTRRDFIQGICGVGILLALGAAAQASEAQAALVRPPGGQNQARLDALCLKCNKCVEACPTQAIKAVHLEDGILQARTPVLDFHLGYCTLCGDCLSACPTGALKSADIKKACMGVATVVKESCIAWQWGGCTKCKEACPYEAISLDSQERPVVDQTKCNGCGKCEFICPAAKVRSYTLGRRRGIVVVPADQRPHGRASA